MKVFAARRFAAAEPSSFLRDRITQTLRRAAERLAALNARFDEGRSVRDRANQANHAIDRAFWIYLR
jgi:hypothetical protein